MELSLLPMWNIFFLSKKKLKVESNDVRQAALCQPHASWEFQLLRKILGLGSIHWILDNRVIYYPSKSCLYNNKFHGPYSLLGQEVLVGLWVHLCQEGPIKEKYVRFYQLFVCTSGICSISSRRLFFPFCSLLFLKLITGTSCFLEENSIICWKGAMVSVILKIQLISQCKTLRTGNFHLWVNFTCNAAGMR